MNAHGFIPTQSYFRKGIFQSVEFIIFGNFELLVIRNFYSLCPLFLTLQTGVFDISRYTPCLKKTVQNYFSQNFVKFPPTVKIFGSKMAKRISLREVYSFSTSPNLC